MRLGLPDKRRRFWRAQSGATAPEFALVAMPFFFLLFSILEIGLIFVVDAVLDDAVIESGRLIRTGQASDQEMTQEEFLDAVCDRMVVFESNCRAANNTHIDVRVVEQFDVDVDNPAEDGEITAGETGFDMGAPESLVLVRVWYEHPIVTAFLAPGVAHGPGNHVILASTTAFRNEPA